MELRICDVPAWQKTWQKIEQTLQIFSFYISVIYVSANIKA